MAKETSLVVKCRDYSNIAQLQDPQVLEEFLDQPLTYIAETITGALGDGVKGLSASGGRIVQAILKGRAFQQFDVELKRLRATGRIAPDFAEKKYGFQTWVELMTIIDEEAPDADRLEALKAMFYAVNKVDANDGERIAAYQLWQIAKQLTSGELLLLKVVFEKRAEYPTPQSQHSFWLQWITNAAGHGIRELILINEKKLMEFGLLSPRFHSDGATINSANARLTDLGVMFCVNIGTYELEMGKSDPGDT